MKKTIQPIQMQVILLTVVRTILNTGNRMVYPFLAVFARGLGIDLASISLVMSVRSFTAMLNPFLAPMVEKRGPKTGMLLSIGLFTGANIALFIWPTFPVFFVSQCISYLCMYFALSSALTFVGHQIPYAVRGRSTAIMEFSWSLSFIIGVPLIGLLIERAGWQAPFPLIAALGIVSFFLVMRYIPNTDPAHKNTINLLAGLKHIFTSPSTVAGLIFSILFHISNESINLVFGVWIEDSFGLKIAALGGAALVIGVADLAGEGISAMWVDRIGKKRAVALGLSFYILVALLLPWLGKALWSALIGLFLFFLSFEFIIVSFIPMMSEVLPKARATVLAYDVAAHAAGRGIGALVASALYAVGFQANSFAAVGFGLLALILLSRVKVPEGKPGS